MELYPIQYPPWPFFLANPSPFLLHPAFSVPENFVSWSESPESHLFRADLPGVRKEEVRVEVEDSRYLIIRTEFDEGGGDAEPPASGWKRFMRKFRLPDRVDVDGISAAYADGVLTVTVPRLVVRGRPRILPSEVPQGDCDAVARAA
ncbi:hypothetical protein Taro_035298 [Colocasia esculenta]|uniref:SHSP domain-containing protein n=1 Tax=Colocasia esculenta TaxID=4460 RepID=A0A843WCT0_COLES|nr:hypothetical protein [Colocasia esculenta]